MGEFGHIESCTAGACIDIWGAGPFLVAVGGKLYRFEDSDQFGPFLLTRRNDVASKQPGERHPFWAAYYSWVKQGRRLQDDKASCIYDPPQPTIYRRINRRNVLVIEHGDEWGDFIEEGSPAEIARRKGGE